MGEIWIDGNVPLAGETQVQGSKNAALPMIAAALLHEGVTVLHGCPRILDVLRMEKIVSSLGVKTCWEGNSLILDCRKITGWEILDPCAGSMRSSVILLGSMLARKRKLHITCPGGCAIGKRPVDLHLMAMKAMGATIEEKEGILLAASPARMQAARIEFPFSSVGATENALLAAVLAKGTTYLINCAVEPEITHLCYFLQAMGAEIGGIGTREIWIRGVQALRDVEYQIPADRIVAGTYLYAAAATRGQVTLKNAPVQEMQAVLEVYEKMGGQWEQKDGKLLADAREIACPVSYVETACYPGFPTDMQSVLMAVLLTIPGESHLREKIFEDRFKVVAQFGAMGGKVTVEGQDAWIKGGNPLRGAIVKAQELRGGAALVAAGLAATGSTVVKNSHFIERGYENLEQVITELGGRISLKEEG